MVEKMFLLALFETMRNGFSTVKVKASGFNLNLDSLRIVLLFYPLYINASQILLRLNLTRNFKRVHQGFIKCIGVSWRVMAHIFYIYILNVIDI